MFVYQLMQQKNIAVDDETKQSLLELLCFYNHEEPLPVEQHEERTFVQSNERRHRAQKSWIDGGMAEKLFQEFGNKSEKAYAALIRGMAKYYQVIGVPCNVEEIIVFMGGNLFILGRTSLCSIYGGSGKGIPARHNYL